MGDIGDHLRDVKDYKRALRNYWNECPHCRLRFGIGIPVAPGRKCRNDGWLSPGEVGDDLRTLEAEFSLYPSLRAMLADGDGK